MYNVSIYVSGILLEVRNLEIHPFYDSMMIIMPFLGVHFYNYKN